MIKELTENTLFIIKPDAIRNGLEKKMLARIINEGFKIMAMKNIKLTKLEAENFYYIHKGKQFYEKLIDFMSSGNVVICKLNSSGAVKKLRKIVGATDPKQAEPGSLRNLFGRDIQQNAVHASDSLINAKQEVEFFFPPQNNIITNKR